MAGGDTTLHRVNSFLISKLFECSAHPCLKSAGGHQEEAHAVMMLEIKSDSTAEDAHFFP